MKPNDNSNSSADAAASENSVSGDHDTQRFVFVLLADHSALSLISALETLRVANRDRAVPFYRWETASIGGNPVRNSLGETTAVNGPLPDLRKGDVALVVGGDKVHTQATLTLTSWLRYQFRHGVEIAGLCTAAHILAQAGLLSGKNATIHWENHDSFLETFPDVNLHRRVIVSDGKLHTTAGGTSSIDLILALIARDHGQLVAKQVAGKLNYHDIRVLQQTTRIGSSDQIGVRNPRMRRALELMSNNLEYPLAQSEIAGAIGISVRQLERLFRAYVGDTPKRYYNRLRLQRVQALLLQSNLSIGEISMASGFTSMGHFAKLFRAEYGMSPAKLRDSIAVDK